MTRLRREHRVGSGARLAAASALLELRRLELERLRVLADGAYLGFVETVGRDGFDVDADLQCHPGRRAEWGQDLVGELLELGGVPICLQARAAEKPRLPTAAGSGTGSDAEPPPLHP